MILFRRVIPFVTLALLLGLFELLLVKQGWFWFLLPLFLALGFVPAGVLLGWRFPRHEFWQLLIPPASLVLSSLLLLVFLADSVLVQLMVILVSALVWLYLENVFHYYHQPGDYQPYALDNISLYVGLLSVFFLFSALYAARVFLSIPLLALLVSGMCFSALFSFQLLWGSSISRARIWVLLSAIAFMMIEIFAVVILLPTTFFVAGLLLVIPYYLMMNITRHAVRDTLTRSVILRNTAVGVVGFAATLLAAPWT